MKPPWCTILAAVAIMIVGSIGWAILEVFDKAVCPYQNELSQEIQQKMLNKLNNFFGKDQTPDSGSGSLFAARAARDRLRRRPSSSSYHVRTSCNYW